MYSDRMLKSLLKVAVSGGLIVWLIDRSEMPMLWDAFRRIGGGSILIAALILVALVPLLTWRWQRIAIAVGVSIPLPKLARIVLIGTFFNQVLPSAIGGDAIRAWLLKTLNVPLTQGLSSIFLDRLFALLGMLLVGGLGLNVWIDVLPFQATQALALIVLLGLAGLGAVFFLCRKPQRQPSGTSRLGNLSVTLQSVLADFRKLLRDPVLVAQVFGVSVLIHAIVSIIFWLFAQQIGMQVTFLQIFVCVAVALILSVIPVSAAGWGVREGALVLLLAPLGVASVEAIALSVAFGLASLFAGIPGMLLWLFGLDRNNRNHAVR